MANSYVKGSFALKIPEGKLELLKQTIHKIKEDYEDDPEWGYVPFEVHVDEKEKEIFFHHGENINIEEVVKAAQQVMGVLGITDSVTAEFAFVCDKPRPNEFGGEAFAVKEGLGPVYISTSAIGYVANYLDKASTEGGAGLEDAVELAVRMVPDIDENIKDFKGFLKAFSAFISSTKVIEAELKYTDALEARESFMKGLKDMLKGKEVGAGTRESTVSTKENLPPYPGRGRVIWKGYQARVWKNRLGGLTFEYDLESGGPDSFECTLKSEIGEPYLILFQEFFETHELAEDPVEYADRPFIANKLKI
jgi:hypothetical protein